MRDPYFSNHCLLPVCVASLLATLTGCSALGLGASPRDVAADRNRLGLKLERAGADVRLTWDRTAPAIARAQGGVLSIWERDQRRDVLLEVPELQTGLIHYTPATDDVVFRLRVFGPGGPVSESIRALRGSAPPSAGAAPEAGVSHPAPPEPAAQNEPEQVAGAPGPGPEANQNVQKDQEFLKALDRMVGALRDPRFHWRSIAKLASVGGVSQKEAVELLRSQPDVTVKTGSSGQLMARLNDR